MKKIRLLLVEDNRLLRDGILSVLKLQKDIEIFAESEESNDMLKTIKILKPNIVLLNIGLMSQDSLDVVGIMKKDFPDVKIIIMDLTPEEPDILQFVKAGADGFILKDASLDDLLFTIRSAAEGCPVVPKPLTDSLFSQIIEDAVKAGQTNLKESIRMTPKEKEVLEFLCKGMNNIEIGQQIHLTNYYVKSHIQNIIEKIVLHSRLEAAKYIYSASALKAIANNIPIINN